MPLFRVSRKAWRETLGWREQRALRINTIEDAGDRECACFSGHALDHLYLAGRDLIPTHNTFSGAHEVAMHLTGEYPDWWRGYRFTGPIVAWATGDAGDSVRDTTQRLLIGEPNRWGTGAIPARCLTPMMSKARGVTGLLDYIRVKSRFGGTSMLRFRYYKQERTTWQGPPVDLIWYDEEPPEDMYRRGPGAHHQDPRHHDHHVHPGQGAHAGHPEATSSRKSGRRRITTP